jgi:tetratricopeptide (TPR) repeat protein
VFINAERHYDNVNNALYLHYLLVTMVNYRMLKILPRSTYVTCSRLCTSSRFVTCITTKPDIIQEVKPLLQQTNHLWQSGEFSEAIQFLKKHSIRLAPSNTIRTTSTQLKTFVFITEKLSSLLVSQNREQEARKTLSDALSLCNAMLDTASKVRLIMSMVDICENDNQAERTILLSLKQLFLSPNESSIVLSPLYQYLAIIFKRRATNERYSRTAKIAAVEKALELFEKALAPLSRDNDDRSKQFLLSYFGRGVCQLLYNDLVVDHDNGRFVFAKEDMDRVVSLNDQYFAAYFYRGEARFFIGDYGYALMDFNHFYENLDDCIERITHDAGTTRGKFMLNLAMKRAKCFMILNDRHLPVDVITEFINMGFDDELNSIAYHTRGFYHLWNERYLECIDDNSRAILLNSELVEAYRDRSKANEKLGLNVIHDLQKLEELSREQHRQRHILSKSRM